MLNFVKLWCIIYEGGARMNDITILHLSDLHIDSSGGRGYTRLLKGLLSDIKKEIIYVKEKTLVVVVTGDIIHRGEKNYCNVALKFFEDLYKIVAEKVLAIYIVPGNHDKYRNKENEFLIPAYRSMRSNSKCFNDVFFDSFWNFHLEAYKQEKGSGYLELTENIYKIFGMSDEVIKSKSFVKNTFGVDTLSVNDKNYCFILLNTAWSCIDDNDNRNLILGNFQIEEIKRQFYECTNNDFDNTYDLTIVLGHHPIGCLEGTEEDNIFNEMVSFEQLDANVYLCGHTHDRTVINWVNKRHSLNTFMTGVGWPESGNGNNIGLHTYSMYVFNLDANSIDIYVKNTDDGGSFQSDFRIYTNEYEKDSKKIVFPIRTQNSQPYISLSTGTDRSNKAYYISKEFMEYIQQYTTDVGRLRYNIGKVIEQTKNEFFENIYDDEMTDELDGVLYNHIFASMNEEIPLELIPIFDKNKNLIFETFLGFLMKISQQMQFIFVNNSSCTSDEIVRFHFRYLADKNTFQYLTICSSISSEFDLEENEVSEMNYGDLIQGSYETQSGLIYSLNEEMCSKKLKEKWTNFITIVPIFDENNFKRRYSTGTIKRYPYITFGVTTNSFRINQLLYCMDYFSFNAVLAEILDDFLNAFNVDLEKFCVWLKKKQEMERNNRL